MTFPALDRLDPPFDSSNARFATDTFVALSHSKLLSSDFYAAINAHAYTIDPFHDSTADKVSNLVLANNTLI